MNFTKLRSILATATILGLVLLLPANARAAAGDLYVGDTGTNTLYRVSPAGTKTVVSSAVGAPISLAFDPSGNLFVKDNSGFKLFKVTPEGAVSLFASNVYGGGLAVDKSGNVFVAETGNNVISKFTPAGVKSTFASGLNSPYDLAFDSAGNLFSADFGGNVVYKFTPAGGRTTAVPNITNPTALAFDPSGNLFVAAIGRGGYKIFKVAAGSSNAVVFADADNQTREMVCDKIGALYAVGLSTSITRYSATGSRSTYLSGFSSAYSITQEPARSQPVNIATRMQVLTGDQALIAGFIITGTGGKKVLLRGIGPSLSQFGINGALQDPKIELRNASGEFVNGNDNWRSLQESAIQATGLAPSDNRESAFLISLTPGAWTAVLRGAGTTTGVGLVEVYDLDQAAPCRLANISTRGYVQTGENVMIGGFVIGSGNGAGKVLVRGIGPSLAAFGITNALADPQLEIHNASGATIATNDDWHDSQQAEIQATGLAPSSAIEAAAIETLPSGSYTAIVSGYNATSGVGLVEVYNLQ
jgi:sugar lactone lactonase YvrE